MIVTGTASVTYVARTLDPRPHEGPCHFEVMCQEIEPYRLVCWDCVKAWPYD